MRGTPKISIKYSRLRKYYMVNKFGSVQPYWVHWRKLLEYLKKKKDAVDFEMGVNWIKEDRLCHKKKVFLQLTNDYQWGDLQPAELANVNWVGSTAQRYAKRR